MGKAANIDEIQNQNSQNANKLTNSYFIFIQLENESNLFTTQNPNQFNDSHFIALYISYGKAFVSNQKQKIRLIFRRYFKKYTKIAKN